MLMRQSGSERLSDLRVQVPAAATRTNRGNGGAGSLASSAHRRCTASAQLNSSSGSAMGRSVNILRKFLIHAPDRHAPGCFEFLFPSCPPLPSTYSQLERDTSVVSHLRTIIHSRTFHSLFVGVSSRHRNRPLDTGTR